MHPFSNGITAIFSRYYSTVYISLSSERDISYPLVLFAASYVYKYIFILGVNNRLLSLGHFFGIVFTNNLLKAVHCYYPIPRTPTVCLSINLGTSNDVSYQVERKDFKSGLRSVSNRNK